MVTVLLLSIQLVALVGPFLEVGIFHGPRSGEIKASGASLIIAGHIWFSREAKKKTFESKDDMLQTALDSDHFSKKCWSIPMCHSRSQIVVIPLRMASVTLLSPFTLQIYKSNMLSFLWPVIHDIYQLLAHLIHELRLFALQLGCSPN